MKASNRAIDQRKIVITVIVIASNNNNKSKRKRKTSKTLVAILPWKVDGGG